jgi:hypothetical protein
MHEHLLVNKLYEKYPKLEKVELIEELIWK